MDLEPQFQSLVANLAALAAKNSAAYVADRVSRLRASKRDEATFNALAELVDELAADKAEAMRIASAFEQELVAQRISDDDITFMTETVVPLIEKFALSTTGEGEAQATQDNLDALKALLSADAVNVLQLVGFNFKEAVGAPLTDLLASVIRSKAQTSESPEMETQRAYIEFQTEMAKLSQDEAAFQRYLALTGNQ
ncbi:hypothetical protein [Citricoccus sp. GCM10030269]|uniref:hypothetical protein n=1 Tax=Citricoccus sp. GCM10030269 TaxID=3273388 RepID=UPI003615D418